MSVKLRPVNPIVYSQLLIANVQIFYRTETLTRSSGYGLEKLVFSFDLIHYVNNSQQE